MLSDSEASSSPCIAGLLIEEDPSLPLILDKAYRFNVIPILTLHKPAIKGKIIQIDSFFNASIALSVSFLATKI